MHLPHDRCFRRAGPVTALLLVTAMVGSVAAGQQLKTSPEPTREEIARAVEAVKADPLLTAERTFKTLRWNDTARRETRPSPVPPPPPR